MIVIISSNNKFNVSIITYSEAKEKFMGHSNIVSLIDNSQNYKYCRAKVYPDFLAIMFCIPEKSNTNNKISFLCLVTETSVTFIDNSGKVGACIKKIQNNMIQKETSVGRFLYDFLEILVESELRNLEELGNRLTKLENSVINTELQKFDHDMFIIKKEILAYYRYYSQIIDIGQELQENENGFFNEENISYFELFTGRATQFHEEAKILRDYTLQLREVYQTQLEIKQNKIMKVLTVVTTIFSPLTIIVGWYGMNFTNMPELNWKYGYLWVTLLSISVSLICIWILRKKKFL